MAEGNGKGSGKVLLEVRNLVKHFPVTRGLILQRQVGAVKAVDGVDFSVQRGETFGMVGESGCGKTTTGKMVLLLERPTRGEILFEGKDINTLKGPGLRSFRGDVQAVFQDPYSSLSPRMKVADIISEPIVVNQNLSRREVRERVQELVDIVGLPREAPELYPHEFSGGQRQRIAVARALALNPDLIVLDEPVSALDVSIRAQVMNLLKDLQNRFNLTYFLIAHDLAVVQHMSNSVGVMYLGKLAERASSDELYLNTLHPYTKALLSAALPADPEVSREEIILTGEVPSPLNPPPGCRFHPRCPFAFDRCSVEEPQLKEKSPGHWVACHLY
ncbi:MAG: ATP-binding cassette domain-containing protein [Dehalococcoidia bacterium]|nr:ATP-binding cassette domain-containing protein [Dehalococcoidia bacterium]